jgi:hypothetical protein
VVAVRIGARHRSALAPERVLVAGYAPARTSAPYAPTAPRTVSASVA